MTASPNPVAIAGSEPDHETADTQAAFAEIRSRASRPFERATFFKPRVDEPPQVWQKIAPLIAMEIPPGFEQLPAGAGPRALTGPNTSQRSDTDDYSVVYWKKDTDEICALGRSRYTYIWFPFSDLDKTFTIYPAPVPWTAVSITLDSEGFPIIVRARSLMMSMTRFFVSERLEESARKEFGPPVSGRLHSIETFLEQPIGHGSLRGGKPSIVVSFLESGPEPSGPWVYVEGKDRTVSTVLCRCSASQMKSIVKSTIYELRPYSELPNDVRPLFLEQSSSAELRIPHEIP